MEDKHAEMLERVKQLDGKSKDLEWKSLVLSVIVGAYEENQKLKETTVEFMESKVKWMEAIESRLSLMEEQVDEMMKVKADYLEWKEAVNEANETNKEMLHRSQDTVGLIRQGVESMQRKQDEWMEMMSNRFESANEKINIMFKERGHHEESRD